MAILETEALSRRFGDLVAVDSLTMAVEAREVFGLLGPNGAGKTTVIKMLTTLLPPTSGTARVAGFDIKRQAAQVRRIIGYVPQMLSADGALTGYENLLIFAKLYDLPRGERKARVRRALDLMGLTDAADRLVRTYSGGMIRRLEIAQSMLHRAASAVPRRADRRARSRGAAGGLGARSDSLRTDYGTTILLTTHYMEEADTLCDRVAIMHLGRIVPLGTPAGPQGVAGRRGRDCSMMSSFTMHGAATGIRRSYREASRTRRTARRLG